MKTVPLLRRGALPAMSLIQYLLWVGNIIGGGNSVLIVGAFPLSPPFISTTTTRQVLPHPLGASSYPAHDAISPFLRYPLTLHASSLENGSEDEYDDDVPGQSITVTIDTNLTDDKLKSLFAWIKCAFDSGNADVNDPYAAYYNDIQLAIAAVFGNNLPKNSVPATLLRKALEAENLHMGKESELVSSEAWDEELIGDSISKSERESASLGAMGAAQWSGRFMTRPHALLRVTDFDDVNDWEKDLPRGCKRTLKKSTPEAQNFTVTTKQIQGGSPAPHSSYAHFRCVVEHEVRLLLNMYGSSTGAFVNALAEAISRYMGTTRMAGSIREYRDSTTNRVLGFAHEVGKGRTTRGQWFYCDNDAAKRYVWFHSVADLVRRAVDDERVDVVDLGPSGSDAFSELKARYGFESVVDWPAEADYSGDFHYEDGQNEDEAGGDIMRMLQQMMRQQQG